MRRGRRGATERRIDSSRNATISQLRRLERNRAQRSSLGLHLAWGLHLAQEALRAGVHLDRAVVGPNLEGTCEGREVLRLLRESGTTILWTTTRVLDGIVSGCGDQGVLLVVPRPRWRLRDVLARQPSLVTAVHGIQDPGNLGSIVRTAEAFGSGALIALEGCADPYASRTVRAAMGAHFRLPIVSSTAGAALPALGAARFQIVAADSKEGVRPVDVDLRRATTLLLGGEGRGLPASLLRQADRRVRIPMGPGVSSLNVHAAAASLLYESARQREFKLA